MMWHSLIKARKSQIFITVLIIFVIIMGLGAALLFHSRAAREIARMQGAAGRAYSLAKSGLDIGRRLAGASDFDHTYNIGGGTLQLTFSAGTGTLTSTGTVGASTRVLKRIPCAGWAKAYGISTDHGYFARQTSDGGYILGGWTDAAGAGGRDFLMIRTDSTGKVTWKSTYGGTGNEQPSTGAPPGVNVFWPVSTGGYLFGGASDSYQVSRSANDFLAIKILDDGTVDWARVYRGAKDDYLTALQQTSSGKYILGGYTTSKSFGSITTDSFLAIETQSGGTQNWIGTYDTSGSDWLYALDQTSDGNYILAGTSNYAGTSDWNAVVIKVLGSNGSIDWKKAYGGSGEEKIFAIRKTSDGGYILGGYTTSFGPTGGGLSFLAIKIDVSGTVLWAKAYDENLNSTENIYGILETSDGYILVGGTTYASGSGAREILMIKVKKNDGDIIWGKVCGDQATHNELIHSVSPTQDGGYILGGETTSWSTPAESYDFLAIKTGSSGDLCGCSPNICRSPTSLRATPITIASITLADPPFTAISQTAPSNFFGDVTADISSRRTAPSITTTDVCK